MTFHENVFGIFAAALTPLHPDGSLALDDLPQFLDFLAGRGCHGAFILGTTGEGPSFSPSEREQLLRAALGIRQVHPEFKLLAGTGTPSLSETIELTRDAFDLGYDGVVVLPPYYYRKVSDDGLFDWYVTLLQNAVPSGAALLAYHIPHVTGIPFSMELLARLRDACPDRFAGIKDTSNDPEFAREMGKRFGNDMVVLSGNDSLLTTALNAHARGCITAMANLRSADSRQVWEAITDHKSLDGGIRSRNLTAVEAQARLDQARSIMDRYPPNPSLYKALVARMYGFPRWAVRPPLLPLSEAALEKALKEAVAEIEDFDL